ncbi:hypothetical protein DDZ18_11840 [Marinicauda salina]|uniref:Enoyl reductase (ER) domain-containing protein n=1 Tax=Marinicauda salina TaxID=2135793 RepID=A0A2U2BR24_9PROT|nr:NADPH:quinone reductase [Marinicauda salina]PWE16461.1 hypothetical protein DDZ18_11840 [Marinicauda salina]
MKAIWYEEQGPAADVLTLGEVDPPEPGPGEVAVFVHASGVNPVDVKMRAGKRGPMIFKRQTPHSDGAGVIRSVGEGVEPGRIGERVWLYGAAARRARGTCAEVCAVPAENAVALPDHVEFEEGAAIGVPAMTAHRAVFCNGPVEGETVLVTGGAGMVGQAAIQLAKWAGAGQVLATISSPEKAEAAYAAGADLAIDYRRQDVVDAVMTATGGTGVDHLVEVEFGGNLPTTVEIMRNQGVVAVYGSEAEREPTVPIYRLMQKNVRIQPILVLNATPEQRAAAVHDITSALNEAALKLPVSAVFPLEHAVGAHELVESGDRIGAVVVKTA